MANLTELNEEGWQKFLSTMPEHTRIIAEKYPPHKLYQLQSTKQYVIVLSYSEDNSLTVGVLANQHFLEPINFSVFGIVPSDLLECDIPKMLEGYEL